MFTKKQKGIAIYYQIEEFIRDKINKKEWLHDSKIPSELELSDFFNVSRASVRQALSNLTNEGLLIRKQGLGTFVVKPSFEGDYLKLYFPPEFGIEHKLLEINIIMGKSNVSNLLKLSLDEPICEIVRLRFIADEEKPSILEKSYYSLNMFPGLEDYDLTKRIFDIIENEYGINLVKADITIEPVLLNSKEAGHLNSKKGSPVLLLTRVSFTYDRVPVVVTKSLILAEKCRLLIKQ